MRNQFVCNGQQQRGLLFLLYKPGAMMVAFYKNDGNLKSSDKKDCAFVYRELRNDDDKNCTVQVENNDNEASDGNETRNEVTNDIARPRLTQVSVYQNDYLEMTSNCSTLISTALLLIILCLLLLLGRDYVRSTLLWLETQEDWIVFALFIVLFTLVSFPFTWGYILLNVACGYLQGLVLGMVLVVVAVTCGVIISHALIKRFLSEFLKTKLLSNNSIRATLAVMGGPQAFRVVAFTRLTPIPFGLQNAIFAISTISTGQYLAATCLGLFPTQVINVYLGSTVRSMEDILYGTDQATIGYIVFIVQILISIGLFVYVIQRARQELRRTVHFQIVEDPQEITVTSSNCYTGGGSSL